MIMPGTPYFVLLDPEIGNELSPSIGAVVARAIDFPSGLEPHVTIDAHALPMHRDIIIIGRPRSMDDVFRILLVTDIVRTRVPTSISLYLPYIPFARQDRRTDGDAPFSLRVFADIINAQGYRHVWAYDPHSDVAEACIRNLIPIPNTDEARHSFDIFCSKVDAETVYVVSPDAGAYKKIHRTVLDGEFDMVCKSSLKTFGGVITASKVRDVRTGAILGVDIGRQDMQGAACLILDDICDGGRTFIELARALQQANAGPIGLFVSHGIFSKTLNVFDGLIDQIYWTSSFPTSGGQTAPISVFHRGFMAKHILGQEWTATTG